MDQIKKKHISFSDKMDREVHYDVKYKFKFRDLIIDVWRIYIKYVSQ